MVQAIPGDQAQKLSVTDAEPVEGIENDCWLGDLVFWATRRFVGPSDLGDPSPQQSLSRLASPLTRQGPHVTPRSQASSGFGTSARRRQATRKVSATASLADSMSARASAYAKTALKCSWYT